MRNKSLTTFFCILLLAFSIILPKLTLAYEQEINSLSTAMAEKIVTAGKKTVAVVDFTDLQGNVTELGRFLAEEFSVAIAGTSKGFEVVDRTHLKSILAEHKLSATGLIDPQTARKLGQIAGVDAIITGTITPFGDSIRVSVKVLDTATAKVISASTGNIAKTKAIEELLTRGIESPQSSGQQVPATGNLSSAGNLNSKKVGDIVVTVKKIMVSSKQITVISDFFNQSDEGLRLARDKVEPRLMDEKGNIFEYRDGITYSWYAGWERNAQSLNSKSHNDVVLYFKSEDVNIKDIGSIFTFSFNYVLYNLKDKSIPKYNVSFTDIKAQKN